MTDIVEQTTDVPLTDRERRKTAASLMMTATIQDALGDAAGALESLLLRSRYLEGLEDDQPIAA